MKKLIYQKYDNSCYNSGNKIEIRTFTQGFGIINILMIACMVYGISKVELMRTGVYSGQGDFRAGLEKLSFRHLHNSLQGVYFLSMLC